MCSDSFKMFLHFVESRSVLSRVKHSKPILLHKVNLSREKVRTLKHARAFETPGGITYVLPPPPLESRPDIFQICVCGNCNATFRSLKSRMARPRV